MLKKLINEKSTSYIIEILSVGLVIFIAYLLFLNNSHGLNTLNNGDVHRGFGRGVNVWNGVNSYLEFDADQMLTQEKVPGFFPLYFYLMALIAGISKFSFVLFLDNLRRLVFFSYIGIGLLIYLKIREKNKLLALFGMTLFMFNRWVIDDVLMLKQDSYVILLLLLSLFTLKKSKPLSFLLFGVATAIKHMTIFAFPIYLLELIKPIYDNRKKLKKEGLRKLVGKPVINLLLLLLPILGPAVPYIIDTPKQFTHSIMYNMTRESEGTAKLVSGFDELLVLYNQDRNNSSFFYMLPRAPMVLVLGLLVLALFTGRIDSWTYAASAYLVFVAFNPVIFVQYYTWFMAFLPLALLSARKPLTQ